MDNIHLLKETTLTVEKKPLVLVLPYLGSISLQTRTKLKKSLKNILNCCKLQIVFQIKTRLGNNFHFKGQIPKDLTSVLFINFSVDSAMSPIMVNVWDTWILELVRILVYHHLAENKLRQEQLRSRSFTTLQPFSILWRFSYSNAWEQKVFTSTERKSVNNER